MTRWTILDAAEEARLAPLARAGDADARARLAESVLGLARKLSGRYALLYRIDADDAFGAAQLGVLKAVDRFDPAKGRLGTTAGWWIRQAVQRHAPEAKGVARLPFYLTKPAHAATRRGARRMERWHNLDDAASVPAPSPREEPDTPALAALARLPARQREAIGRSAGLGGDAETDAEIARSWKSTWPKVRDIRRQGLATIRRELKGEVVR
jgi:RNA polymerase sigma factor (sigma-70 family)